MVNSVNLFQTIIQFEGTTLFILFVRYMVEALGFFNVFLCVLGSVQCGSANRTLTDLFSLGKTVKHPFGRSLRHHLYARFH